MIGLLLIAEDALPDSQAWWGLTLSWVARFGVVAGAAWSVHRLIRLMFGQAYDDWREARQIRRSRALLKAIGENTEEIRKVDAKVDARHRHNTREIEEVNRSVNRVAVQVKEIHKRIDRHMDEERAERHEDRAELMGLLREHGFMRREDVQRLRDAERRQHPIGEDS